VQDGADGGGRYDVYDVSWASESCVGPAAFTPQGKVLGSLSVPNNWVFRRRNKRLQAHRPSIYVDPLPIPLLAQAGRFSGHSSVSPQVAAARKRAAIALAMQENARDLGAINACVAGKQNAVV
jgi:hypothetical protein